jgi:hypothetical protein
MENNMKIPYLFVGLLAVLPTLGAQAADKVYKWKDANGVVHFTDQPPPQGTEFDSVAVKGAAAITQSNDVNRVHSADKSDDATADNGADAAANGEPAPKPDPAKARCDEARQRLALLQGKNDVAIQENGKAVLADKDRRAAEINIAKAQVQSYCPQPAN